MGLFSHKIESVEKEYFGFYVTSEAGEIQNLEALNNYRDNYAKFDTLTWDGSDLFTLRNTSIIACTEKVKDLLEDGNVKNVTFKRL